METPPRTRRKFLLVGAAGAASLAAATLPAFAAGSPAKPKAGGDDEEDISPAEDLMREHGILKRVLLVYDEGVRRLDSRQDLPVEPIADAARLVRTFVEDYHERLEEDHLFPRFRKANRLVPLVDVLLSQHQAGRKLTETTLGLATAGALRDEAGRRRLRDALAKFVRMYAPHEAREDTVLFPALASLIPKPEYEALGEKFEKEERRLFGQDGFEKMVDRVARIEKALGIEDLAQFTPAV